MSIVVDENGTIVRNEQGLDPRSSTKLKIRMHGILGSTMISALGYDLLTKTLRVKFKRTKKVYDYRYVPAEVFAALMSAGSVGVAAHAQLLNNYKYVEVELPLRKVKPKPVKSLSVNEIVSMVKEGENNVETTISN